MFRLVDPRPVNVIMRALPIPPRKVTELLPLPAHPAQVKIPDVENVTGSALASDVPTENIARSNALIRVALITPAMSGSLCFASIVRPHLPSNEGTLSHGLVGHPVLRLMFPQLRGKRSGGTMVFGALRSIQS